MTKTKYIVAGVLLTLLIAPGCVIKKYRAPDFKPQIDSLRQSLEIQADTTVRPLAWQEFFNDSILQGYIRRVLKHNHNLEISRKNIDIARSQLKAANSSFWPRVEAISLGAGSGLNQSGNGLTPVSLSLSTAMSWEIDIWGRMLSGKRASQAALAASEDGVRALQTSLVAETATYYYRLATYDIELKIIHETIHNRSQYLDTIRVMKRSGSVNEVAVQQAVAQLEEAKAAVPQIELAITQTESALSLLMGIMPHQMERRPIHYTDDSNMMDDIQVPASLIAFRPDVSQAEKAYRNAFELYNVSRAAMYPSLTLSAEAALPNLLAPHFGVLNLLAGLTQPIWNARKLRTQKEVADLQAQQARLRFEHTVLNASQEVVNALIAKQKTRRIAEVQKVQLDAYEKAYEYSFELFVNGYATYLEVLTAQTGVYNTQMSLLNSYLNNLSARIDLYRALGGGAQ